MAEELLDQKRPDIHNQAMMDFGAMQCTPSNPGCSGCPLSSHCMAVATGKVQDYPVKLAGTKKQERFFHYLFLTDGKNTWLQQRVKKDIWQQLWEFPLIENDHAESVESLFNRTDVASWAGKNFTLGTPVYLKHILTHRVIHATFFPIRIEKEIIYPENWKKVKLNEVKSFAVSKLIDSFICKNDLLNI